MILEHLILLLCQIELVIFLVIQVIAKDLARDFGRDVAPSEWYKKMEGLNWESGGAGGEQIPPIESMRAMMPKYDLWPISGSWDIRLWQGMYEKGRQHFYNRYGRPESLEEYCITSQAWQYESNRAIYEATPEGNI